MVFFYIGREGLSLVENYGKLGGRLPSFLSKILQHISASGPPAGGFFAQKNSALPIGGTEYGEIRIPDYSCVMNLLASSITLASRFCGSCS